jgi:hypothetical protein
MWYTLGPVAVVSGAEKLSGSVKPSPTTSPGTGAEDRSCGLNLELLLVMVGFASLFQWN